MKWRIRRRERVISMGSTLAADTNLLSKDDGFHPYSGVGSRMSGAHRGPPENRKFDVERSHRERRIATHSS
jgi:hypothetical protein